MTIVKTESVMLQNLCIPCACRCRYCLLSWDGKPVGIDDETGEEYARRFHEWIREHRPELRFSYSFGYSMDHPRLFQAIDFLRSIGSPGAEFLQMDGMAFRQEEEAASLMRGLREHGVKTLNFTFYGQEAYHDRFAGRRGDHAYLLQLGRCARAEGLNTTAGIPLTKENIAGINACVVFLQREGFDPITLFIPHEEGRGASIADLRLSEEDLSLLDQNTAALLNPEVYRTERDWVRRGTKPLERRALLLSLTPETFERFSRMDFADVIRYGEELDETYYRAFPSESALIERYGDPEGDRLYRLRDLLHHYRKRHILDHALSLHDVTDERFCGSRRY